MAKMKLSVAILESHANGDEGIRYIDIILPNPKHMSGDEKDEWLECQANILNDFIKYALLDAGYEFKER